MSISLGLSSTLASNYTGLQPQKESKDGTASQVRPTPRPLEVDAPVGELRAVASFAKELSHPLLFPREVFVFCGTPEVTRKTTLEEPFWSVRREAPNPLSKRSQRQKGRILKTFTPLFLN